MRLAMMNTIIAHPLFVSLAVLWVLPWKGMALWRAARRKELVWFIALLVVNTLGILEILYLAFFSKGEEKKKERAQAE